MSVFRRIGKNLDPVSILHGMQNYVHMSDRGHDPENYRATRTLEEIEAGLKDWQKGFDTYCHGMSYFGQSR